MKTESKVLLGVIIALIVALPLVSYTFAIPQYNNVSNDSQTLTLREKLRLAIHERLQQQKELAAGWLLKEAKAVTIEGTVVTHFKNILVIDSEGNRLNVLLPPVWSVNSEDKAFNLTEIFDVYVKAGDDVTLQALQRQATNKQNVTITVIFAYEIIDGSNHLYAILPFNIEP